ncbi:hypothetical protein F5Y08DRAFT_88107 [Xylaria arbuscula]|nr:hypothetical protein F5Y08DRAFT_88107 [Xylaria arbuscula]
MADMATRSYLQRSRHGRRVELARYAHEREVNMSVIMGLSLRVKGHQAHIDYTGGLDTVRIYRSLASSFAELSWGGITSRFLDGRGGEAIGLSGARPSETLPTRRKVRAGTICWRDAVARAAPVDRQRPGEYRLDGEWAEVHRDRMRVARETKVTDFAPVLERVNKEALANLARELLEQRRRRQQQCPGHNVGPVPLPVIGDPSFGSGHVFYVIRFPSDDGWKAGTGIDGDDGGDGAGREAGGGSGGGSGSRTGGGRKGGDRVQWIVKIPAATSTSSEEGTARGRWNKLCCETLRSEAFLLHLLHQETSIPVPEVIDADCRPDNEVGVPWLLMEYVEGRRLEDVWFTQDEGRRVHGDRGGSLKQRREVILRNVAKAMLELGKYEFDNGGALVFDKRQGELADRTGPLRELDIKAMVLRWFQDEDCSSTPLYCSTEPWEQPRDIYTAFLGDWTPETADEKGVDELLRLLIDQIREPRMQGTSGERVIRGLSDIKRTGPGKQAQTKMKKFVLAHPDLSMRNIVLAKDGTTIKAILGWDGARAAPRSIGNEALPSWLVRDFNPFVWRWKPDAEYSRTNHVRPECHRFEDSPWELRELRAFYASTVRELKEGSEKRKQEDSQKREGRERNVAKEEVVDNHDHGRDGEYGDFDITKQSLLTLTLDAAIRDPRVRALALRRLLEKCSRSFEEFDFDYFVDTLGKGYELDAFKLKCLANNVKELVDKGFVNGAVVW